MLTNNPTMHLPSFLLVVVSLTSSSSAWSSHSNISPLHKAAQTKGQRRTSVISTNMSSSTPQGEEPTKKSLLLSTLPPSSSQNNNIQLILASQSPRRKEIMQMMGLEFLTRPSPFDEEAFQRELRSQSSTICPTEYVTALSEGKSRTIAEILVEEPQETAFVVIGCDTIVDHDGVILEKPKDVEDAMQMARRLSGNWHLVHTGVSIHVVRRDRVELMTSFTESTRVKFADLREEDIEAYVRTGDPMDKAGGYGIQSIGGQMVERIDGDFFNVMGLPMHRLSVELSQVIRNIFP